MRSLSDILSEKEWVRANLKKAVLWCAGGVVITILSLITSSHTGFSIITLGAIGWGGWNVYKCLKRLDELKNEEELHHVHTKDTITPASISKSHKPSYHDIEKKITLRSKTFK